VIDTILDKGLVIDAYVRVSIVGIELLTIDARIVVASVDTYLRFADAVNRLNISEQDPKADLPELVGTITGKATEPVAKDKAKSPLEAAGERLINTLTASAETPDSTAAPKSAEHVIDCHAARANVARPDRAAPRPTLTHRTDTQSDDSVAPPRVNNEARGCLAYRTPRPAAECRTRRGRRRRRSP
jgi:gas vesicle structural protein